jgi:trk system potassium uptake protein TrkA
MKIVIAGAGAVGTHLARLLSGERQDIILIDDNEERLNRIDSECDLMTVATSPTSIEGLRNSGVASANLFVAVTPDESRNITACIIASKLGAKKTVARIDNYEYLQLKNKDYFKSIGVHSLIYPELLAAQEVIDSMKMSWIRQWWEFCDGALIMLGTKVRTNAELLDIPLHKLASTDAPYHIVAIKRGEETIIPHGNDELKNEDIVYFTTTKKYIPYIRKIAGKEEFPDVRNILSMGGSRITSRVADGLTEYMKMKIIEKDEPRCHRLTEILDDKIMIINGDARDMDLLKEEGLDNTDAFIALTSNSESNILACMAAKRAGVRKTVAEVENIDYIALAERFDIGTVINKKRIAASYIYQMMLDTDKANVKSLTFANLDVAEFEVNEGAKATRKAVKDLNLPSAINLGGLIRQGKGVVISGETQIQAGDHIVVICEGGKMIRKAEKFFI